MTEASLSTSRREILVELRQRGAMTVDALVRATGLSKTATRAHLVRMERDGAVARDPVEPDGPGRPPVAFCLTDHGASAFPSEEDALLSQLIRFLKANDGETLVSAFFTSLWSDRMGALRRSLGDVDLEAATLDERLAALEVSLAEKHFMPIIDREPDSDGLEVVTVRECNCPYSAAARASRLPCQLEVDFLSHAIGTRPRSVSIAATRKDPCTFEFLVSAPPSE